ncbi:MAG: hypothetical protein K2I23_01350, partial [Clostridia bacterium]|nr:hypothetical protein [Clostridia bacterium]
YSGYRTVKDGDVAISPTNDGYFYEAGTYVTTVKLTDGSEYTLTWTIEPYTFDLSNVSWNNVNKDGVSEYPYAGGATITPGLNGLTGVLEVLNYTIYANGTSDRTGSMVGDGGSVYVEFQIKSDYNSKNYVLPKQGEKGSYKFDGSGDFLWSINWAIVKVELPISWEYRTYEKDDVIFEYLALKDTANITMSDIIYYDYYEVDSKTSEILDPNHPLTLDQIEVDSTAKKYYKAVPKLYIDAENNYSLPETITGGIFNVGGGSTSITLKLSTNEYAYTGNAVALNLTTSTGSSVNKNNLNFQYYQGDSTVTKLNNAPKDAGTYTVVITSKSGSIVLSGGSQTFTFEIKPCEIDTTWSGTTPPALKLSKKIQLKAIEYRYYDENMVPVSFSNLQAGGSYYIDVILTDTKNFVFVGDNVGETTAQTSLKSFNVNAVADLVDPTDPGNYDFVDDDEKPQIKVEWDTTKNPPELKIPDEYKGQIH